MKISRRLIVEILKYASAIVIIAGCSAGARALHIGSWIGAVAGVLISAVLVWNDWGETP